jgi:hypothetical protein
MLPRLPYRLLATSCPDGSFLERRRDGTTGTDITLASTVILS